MDELEPRIEYDSLEVEIAVVYNLLCHLLALFYHFLLAIIYEKLFENLSFHLMVFLILVFIEEVYRRLVPLVVLLLRLPHCLEKPPFDKIGAESEGPGIQSTPPQYLKSLFF